MSGDYLCMYIPLALAEAYYCQGWEVLPLASHHSAYSLLARWAL